MSSTGVTSPIGDLAMQGGVVSLTGKFQAQARGEVCRVAELQVQEVAIATGALQRRLAIPTGELLLKKIVPL